MQMRLWIEVELAGEAGTVDAKATRTAVADTTAAEEALAIVGEAIGGDMGREVAEESKVDGAAVTAVTAVDSAIVIGAAGNVLVVHSDVELGG
jgi:hypothetical protein